MTVTGDAPRDADSRMLGAVPGAPALVRGPEIRSEPEHSADHHPAAGWGAAKSVARVLAATGEPLAGPRALVKMNHAERGFDCPGCAWPDDLDGLRLDFCEN